MIEIIKCVGTGVVVQLLIWAPILGWEWFRPNRGDMS